ncbi:MAG: methylmalonyl-CoA mutase, partial [Actinobacteria bacterium]|nr:methylmalonyl-CoA mutase [Actinomycetota bacterium]
MSSIPDLSQATLGDVVQEPASTEAIEQAATEAAGRPVEDLRFAAPEGIDLQPAYGSEAVADVDHLDTRPGFAPFLRGPYPTMYVNQPWTVRQYAGFSTAEESNAFYRRNLAAGQKG